MTIRPGLLLSLFSGADLLGRGFEELGWCVVSAGDVMWGRDVRDFQPARHVFEGVFGGSPCQDFSSANRSEPTGYGVAMLTQFIRCVSLAGPEWFLLENVPRVPDVSIPGYTVQRLNLNAKECGSRQNRLRCFQFGYVTGNPLVIARCAPVGAASLPCAMASEGRRQVRRTWADFCELQGLPRDFDLPGLPRALKYKLLGNGVPIPMARVVATAIKVRNVTPPPRLCVCLCGRRVRSGQTMATPGCRKRMQRRRDAAGVTGPGLVTAARINARK